MSVPDVPGNALYPRIFPHELTEYSRLSVIIRLKGQTVLHVPCGMVSVILPQVIRLNPQKDIDIRQALCAEIPRLVPRPQSTAEIPVKAHRQPHIFGLAHDTEGEISAGRRQCRSYPAHVKPREPFKQSFNADPRIVILSERAVPAVIGYLAGTNAVACLKIVRSETVSWCLMFSCEDDGRTMDIVAA